MGRFAAFIILFAMLFAMVVPDDMGHSFANNDEAMPRDVVSERGPSAVASDHPRSELALNSPSTVIARGSDGQFHLDVSVNGQNLPFLIDTGADMVALTIDDARRIGVVVEPQKFQQVGIGAGGAVRGQPILLDNIRVAGHEIGRMDAVVVEGLTHNLLGQSVLRQMGRLELSGDTMTLN